MVEGRCDLAQTSEKGRSQSQQSPRLVWRLGKSGQCRWRGPEWGGGGSREGRGFTGAALDGGVLSGGTGGVGVHWGSNRWRGPEWGDGRGGFIGAAIDGGVLSGGGGWGGGGGGVIGAAIDGGS